jgi:hypothetical protein
VSRLIDEYALAQSGELEPEVIRGQFQLDRAIGACLQAENDYCECALADTKIGLSAGDGSPFPEHGLPRERLQRSRDGSERTRSAGQKASLRPPEYDSEQHDCS